MHDEMIRDRIVVGLRDARLSEKMQLEADLTLEKAITQARHTGRTTCGTRSGKTTPLDSVISYPTPTPTHRECPSQGLRGSGSTACVLASGAFVQTCTNGDWLLQQDASVVPQNRLRTMSSITAQSIGLHMVCMV